MAFDTAANKLEHRATIGPSVSVKGEISGDEDILIEGAVEGQINLKKNSVTVAQTGKVKANIFGVVIRVEGEVVGDITGADKVVVLASGKVVGNISAPRISLEEGAKVKGVLDTETSTEAPRYTESTKLSMRVEESVSVESGRKGAGFIGPNKDQAKPSTGVTSIS